MYTVNTYSQGNGSPYMPLQCDGWLVATYAKHGYEALTSLACAVSALHPDVGTLGVLYSEHAALQNCTALHWMPASPSVHDVASPLGGATRLSLPSSTSMVVRVALRPLVLSLGSASAAPTASFAPYALCSDPGIDPGLADVNRWPVWERTRVGTPVVCTCVCVVCVWGMCVCANELVVSEVEGRFRACAWVGTAVCCPETV